MIGSEKKPQSQEEIKTTPEQEEYIKSVTPTKTDLYLGSGNSTLYRENRYFIRNIANSKSVDIKLPTNEELKPYLDKINAEMKQEKLFQEQYEKHQERLLAISNKAEQIKTQSGFGLFFEGIGNRMVDFFTNPNDMTADEYEAYLLNRAVKKANSKAYQLGESITTLGGEVVTGIGELSETARDLLIDTTLFNVEGVWQNLRQMGAGLVSLANMGRKLNDTLILNPLTWSVGGGFLFDNDYNPYSDTRKLIKDETNKSWEAAADWVRGDYEEDEYVRRKNEYETSGNQRVSRRVKDFMNSVSNLNLKDTRGFGTKVDNYRGTLSYVSAIALEMEGREKRSFAGATEEISKETINVKGKDYALERYGATNSYADVQKIAMDKNGNPLLDENGNVQYVNKYNAWETAWKGDLGSLFDSYFWSDDMAQGVGQLVSFMAGGTGIAKLVARGGRLANAVGRAKSLGNVTQRIDNLALKYTKSSKIGTSPISTKANWSKTKMGINKNIQQFANSQLMTYSESDMIAKQVEREIFNEEVDKRAGINSDRMMEEAINKRGGVFGALAEAEVEHEKEILRKQWINENEKEAGLIKLQSYIGGNTARKINNQAVFLNFYWAGLFMKGKSVSRALRTNPFSKKSLAIGTYKLAEETFKEGVLEEGGLNLWAEKAGKKAGTELQWYGFADFMDNDFGGSEFLDNAFIGAILGGFSTGGMHTAQSFSKRKAYLEQKKNIEELNKIKALDNKGTLKSILSLTLENKALKEFEAKLEEFSKDKRTTSEEYDLLVENYMREKLMENATMGTSGVFSENLQALLDNNEISKEEKEHIRELLNYNEYVADMYDYHLEYLNRADLTENRIKRYFYEKKLASDKKHLQGFLDNVDIKIEEEVKEKTKKRKRNKRYNQIVEEEREKTKNALYEGQKEHIETLEKRVKENEDLITKLDTEYDYGVSNDGQKAFREAQAELKKVYLKAKALAKKNPENIKEVKKEIEKDPELSKDTKLIEEVNEAGTTPNNVPKSKPNKPAIENKHGVQQTMNLFEEISEEKKSETEKSDNKTNIEDKKPVQKKQEEIKAEQVTEELIDKYAKKEHNTLKLRQENEKKQNGIKRRNKQEALSPEELEKKHQAEFEEFKQEVANKINTTLAPQLKQEEEMNESLENLGIEYVNDNNAFGRPMDVDKSNPKHKQVVDGWSSIIAEKYGKDPVVDIDHFIASLIADGFKATAIEKQFNFIKEAWEKETNKKVSNELVSEIYTKFFLENEEHIVKKASALLSMFDDESDTSTTEITSNEKANTQAEVRRVAEPKSEEEKTTDPETGTQRPKKYAGHTKNNYKQVGLKIGDISAIEFEEEGKTKINKSNYIKKYVRIFLNWFKFGPGSPLNLTFNIDYMLDEKNQITIWENLDAPNSTATDPRPTPKVMSVKEFMLDLFKDTPEVNTWEKIQQQLLEFKVNPSEDNILFKNEMFLSYIPVGIKNEGHAKTSQSVLMGGLNSVYWFNNNNVALQVEFENEKDENGNYKIDKNGNYIVKKEFVTEQGLKERELRIQQNRAINLDARKRILSGGNNFRVMVKTNKQVVVNALSNPKNTFNSVLAMFKNNVNEFYKCANIGYFNEAGKLVEGDSDVFTINGEVIKTKFIENYLEFTENNNPNQIKGHSVIVYQTGFNEVGEPTYHIYKLVTNHGDTMPDGRNPNFVRTQKIIKKLFFYLTSDKNLTELQKQKILKVLSEIVGMDLRDKSNLNEFLKNAKNTFPDKFTLSESEIKEMNNPNTPANKVANLKDKQQKFEKLGYNQKIYKTNGGGKLHSRQNTEKTIDFQHYENIEDLINDILSGKEIKTVTPYEVALRNFHLPFVFTEVETENGSIYTPNTHPFIDFEYEEMKDVAKNATKEFVKKERSNNVRPVVKTNKSADTENKFIKIEDVKREIAEQENNNNSSGENIPRTQNNETTQETQQREEKQVSEEKQKPLTKQEVDTKLKEIEKEERDVENQKKEFERNLENEHSKNIVKVKKIKDPFTKKEKINILNEKKKKSLQEYEEKYKKEKEKIAERKQVLNDRKAVIQKIEDNNKIEKKFFIGHVLLRKAVKKLDFNKEIKVSEILRLVNEAYGELLAQMKKEKRVDEYKFLLEHKDEIMGETMYDSSVREIINTLLFTDEATNAVVNESATETNTEESVTSNKDVVESSSENEKSYSKSSFEQNVVKSTSSKIKLLLLGVENPNMRSKFGGITATLSFFDTADALRQITTDMYDNSLKELERIVKAKMKINPEEFGFLQNLLERMQEINKTNPELVNEILYNFYGKGLNMRFVMWYNDRQGNLNVNTLTANNRDPQIVKRDMWLQQLKASKIIKMEDDEYYKVDLKLYHEFSNYYDIAEHYNTPKSEKVDMVIKCFDMLGIKVNKKAVEDYVYNNTGSGQKVNVEGKDFFYKLYGNNSLLGIIKENLIEGIDKLQCFESAGNLKTNNILLTNNIGYMNEFIKHNNYVEFNSNSSLYIAGKTVFMYQDNNHISNKIKMLKKDIVDYIENMKNPDISQEEKLTGLLKRFKETTITSNSYLLSVIEKQPEQMLEFLDTYLVSLEAIKKKGGKSSDRRGVTELSEKDKLVTDLSMFLALDGQRESWFGETQKDAYYKYDDGLYLRKGYATFPTISDSEHLPVLKTALIHFDQTQLNLTIKDEKTGKLIANDKNILGENTLKLLREQMLLGDLFRVADYLSKFSDGKTTNISGYDAGAVWITSMPSLNNVIINMKDENGVIIKRPLITLFRQLIMDNKGANTEERIRKFVEEHKAIIDSHIEENIVEQAEKMLAKFRKNGLVDERGGLKIKQQNNTGYFYSEKKGLKPSAREIAYQYVLNYNIQQKDIQTMFAGDIALYFKDKMRDDMQYGFPRITFQDILNYHSIEERKLINDVLNGKEITELSKAEQQEFIKNFPLFKYSPELITADIHHEEIFNKLLPIIEIKTTQMFKDVQNNLAKRLKELISTGKQYPNVRQQPNYIQLMVNDVEVSSENMLDIISHHYPTKVEMLTPVVNRYLELQRKENKTTEEITEQKELKNQIKKEVPNVSGYLDITSTDAQEYTSWKENLNQLLQQGRLTQENYDHLYKKLEQQSKDLEEGSFIKPENRLTEEEHKMAVMQPSKPLYSGMVSEERNGHKVERYVYIKSSSFPLLPEMTQMFHKLNNLRKNVEKLEKEQGVFVRVSYQSANKVGGVSNSISMNRLYESGTTTQEMLNSSVVLSRDGFYIQQDKPFKSDKNADKGIEDKITLATQFEKIILGDGINNMGYVFNAEHFDTQLLRELNIEVKDGKISGADLERLYNNIYKRHQNLLTDNLLSRLGISDFSDMEKSNISVMEKLSEILKSQIDDKQSKKSLDLVYYATNEEGIGGYYTKEQIREKKLIPVHADFVMNVLVSPNSRKIETALLSLINKNNINLKLPGFSSVVASQQGFDMQMYDSENVNLKDKINFKGQMTYDYGNNKRADIKSESTFEAIKNGERTATTRYDGQGNIDYWKNVKVGDIVEFRSKKGEKVLVRVTKALSKLDENTSAEQWSKKEGWNEEYFEKNVKHKLKTAWQFEYEVIKKENNDLEALKKKGLILTKNFDPKKGLQATRDAKTGKLKSAQVFIANKFKVLNKETGKYEYVDLTQYVDENNFIDTNKLPQELLEMFSFRIPTSSHQSGAMIEIAGFLPHNVGDLMIVPKEHTVQIGEDYDIDVRYVYQYNYIKDEDGNLKKISYADIKTTLKKKEKGVNNSEKNVKEVKAKYDKARENVFKEVFRDEQGRVKVIRYIKSNELLFDEIATLKEALDNYNVDNLIHAIFKNDYDIEVVDKDFLKNKIAELEAKALQDNRIFTEEEKQEYENVINKLRAELKSASSELAKAKQEYADSLKTNNLEQKVLENNVISLYKSVFLSADTGVQQLITKVLSTDFAEDSAVKTNEKINQEEGFFNFYSPHTQSATMKLGADGNKGIGLHSNSVVFNSILQQLKDGLEIMKVDKEGNLKSYNIVLGKNTFDGTFGKLTDKGNKRISEYIGESQNSALDNQKLQIMGRRNENMETITVFSLMQMAGLENDGIKVNGKTLSYASLFISQPVLQKFSELSAYYQSSTNTEYGDIETMVSEEMDKFFEQLMGKEEFKKLQNKKGKEWAKIGEKLDSEFLYNQLTTLENIKKTDLEAQYYIFRAFLEMRGAFEQINSLQKIVNIEKKGLGISFIETLSVREALINLYNLRFQKNNHYLPKNTAFEQMFGVLSDIQLTNDYIDIGGGFYFKPSKHYSYKIANSILLGYNLYHNMFPYDNTFFSNNISKIMHALGKNPDNLTKSVLQEKYSIVEGIKDYLISDVRHIMPNEKVKQLFFNDSKSGTESLGNYLARLKGNPEYSYLFENSFFKNLIITIKGNNTPTNIEFNIGDVDGLTRIEIYNYLESLIHSENSLPDKINGEKVTEASLMRDLLVYSLVANQENNAIGFRRFLPLSLFQKYNIDSKLRNNRTIPTEVYVTLTNELSIALGSYAVDENGIIENTNELSEANVRKLIREANEELRIKYEIEEDAYVYDSESGGILFKEQPINGSNFAKQYIQHNADKVKSFSARSKPLQEAMKDVGLTMKDFNEKRVKEFSVFYSRKLDEKEGIKEKNKEFDRDFITIKTSDGELQLFERVKVSSLSTKTEGFSDEQVFVFRRISKLGAFGFNEYDITTDNKISSVGSNNYENEVEDKYVFRTQIEANVSINSKVHISAINKTDISSLFNHMIDREVTGNDILLRIIKQFLPSQSLKDIDIKTASLPNKKAEIREENGQVTIVVSEEFLNQAPPRQEFIDSLKEELLHYVTITNINKYGKVIFNKKGTIEFIQTNEALSVPTELNKIVDYYNESIAYFENKYGRLELHQAISKIQKGEITKMTSDLEATAYRLSSIHEFIAGVMDLNSEFSRELNEVESKTSKQSIFENIIEALARFLERIIKGFNRDGITAGTYNSVVGFLSRSTNTNEKSMTFLHKEVLPNSEHIIQEAQWLLKQAKETDVSIELPVVNDKSNFRENLLSEDMITAVENGEITGQVFDVSELKKAGLYDNYSTLKKGDKIDITFNGKKVRVQVRYINEANKMRVNDFNNILKTLSKTTGFSENYLSSKYKDSSMLYISFRSDSSIDTDITLRDVKNFNDPNLSC